MVEKCGVNYASTEDVGLGNYDFVLEAVGTPSAVTMAINAAKPGGTVLLMGNPSGDILLKQDVYWRILRKQLTIKGTWNSSYDGSIDSDWTEAVRSIEKKEIDVELLVSHYFAQEHLKDGLQLMLEHKRTYCKVMTIWNE